jgi:RHS repeat-associated protein
MKTLNDGIYRVVLCCVVALGIGSAALMPQGGEFLWTGAEWIDAIWVAGRHGLLKMDAGNLGVLLEIPDPDDVRAVDIDEHRGLVWAFSKNRLRGMTFGGKVLFTVPEDKEQQKNGRTDRRHGDHENDDDDDDDDSENHKQDVSRLYGNEPFGLQVNSNTGTVWLGLKRLLYQFDSEANWIRTLSLPDTGQAMALDELTSILWVATRGALLCYDETGALIHFIELGRRVRVEDIDIDPDSGDIWVVRKNGLSRLDATGQLILETKIKKLTQIVTDRRGGAWLARGKTLARIGAFGELFFEVKPFGKKGKEIINLVVDPLDASVWVASKEEVGHVSASGEVLKTGKRNSKDFKNKKGKVRGLALYVDVTPPQIALTSPLGVLVNNSRPVLILTLADIGEGVDPTTFEFKVNGEEWSFDCVVDDEKEKAACVPIMALPEGAIELSATVQDLNGNLSDPVRESLVVDSVSPEILIVTPIQDEILDTGIPNVRLDYGDPGSGVDPSTFTIQVDGGNPEINCDVGLTSATCDPVTPLLEGLHTLSATIRDLAGNISSLTQVRFTVELVVTPQPPTLDPIENQTVDLGSTLTLQLTASDPNDDPLTFSAFPLPLPINMKLDAVGGLWTFTPDAAQVGTLDLTFIVSDGALIDSQTFSITILGADPSGATALAGRVLDTHDFVQGVETPVVGATISLLGTGFTTTSDTDGNFILNRILHGSQILDIDSSTAGLAGDGSPYSGFREEVELMEGVSNVIERPFFLPRIERESLTPVRSFETTMVENRRLGVVMEVPAFSARNELGSFFSGELSISEVPAGLAPAPLPDQLDPGLLITIQPVGVRFDPPAPITFPNIDSLSPGSEINLWSLDPETGSFIIVGRGRVSDDGAVIETISGGIYAADWHFLLPQAPTMSPAAASSENNSNNQDQSKCTDCPAGSRTAVSSGNLRIEHALASYRSLGESRGLRLIYNSSRADPQPVISAHAGVVAGAAVPNTISSRLAVAGVDQAFEAFTDTRGLSSGVEVRQAVQFDARSFQTGTYPYQLTISGNYNRSSIATVLSGRVLVHNEQNSSAGAGWRLEGVGRLVEQNDDLFLTEGDGSARLFMATSSGSGTFSGLTPLALAGSAVGVAVGDFDRDGISDLAVATNFDVSVFMGDASGNFSGPRSFAAGDLPRSVAVGDFNGDTLSDLAVANFMSDNVSILLGNGSGGFSRPNNFRVGDGPVSVAIGDFDGDAILDLVSGSTNHVSILLGDGSGAFSAPTHLSAGSVPRAVAVGDFNEDRLLDLAVANLQSENVSILLGDGRGSFSDPTHLRVGTRPASVAVGDFNGDAVLDLAVSNFLSNNVSILEGEGDGGFLSPSNYPVGSGPGEVVVGDFDSDEFLDLAIIGAKSNSVSILLGDGEGAFSGPTGFMVGELPQSLAIGDFNGDAVLDLAVANARSNDLSILRGVSSGQTGFQSPPGDFSTVVENNDGSFTRTLKDGTRIHFDSRGLQRSSVDRNGNATRYVYDADERLISITDPVGLERTFSYVGGLLRSITDPAGRRTQFEHDAAGNLTRISDPNGTSRSFEYDSRHRLIAQISKRGFRTSYGYDFAGRNVGVKRPDGSSRGITSSETVGLLDLASGVGTRANPASMINRGDVESLFTDGNGNATRFMTNRFGSTTATTDALGSRTLIERDVDSNPTRILRPNGAVTVMTYDERGNLLSLAKQSMEATTSFTYDSLFNQVRSVTDPEGNRTALNYDTQGNLGEIVDDRGTGTVMVYDDLNCPGQLTSVTAAVGLAEENTTRFGYDPTTCNLVSTVDPLLNETRLAYDQAGNVIESTDAEGRVTGFVYDPLNRLTRVVDASHSDADAGCGTAGVTCYDYDNSDNLTRVTDARGSVTTFEYDSQDRLIQITDPLGHFETFSYDGNGNVLSSTDPKGQTIEFQYDAANQLISKTVLPGTSREAMTHFRYDSLGNLVSVEDPDSLLTMTYDPFSRRTSVSTTRLPDQPGVTLNYTYDKNDNRLSMTGPTGQTEYVYDELNRLTHLTSPSMQTVTFDYDALGRRVQMSLPNGVTTSYTYDAASQLLSLVHQLGANTMNSFAYTYDNVGNRTTLTQIRSAVAAASPLHYVYDDLNRLMQATHPLSTNPLESFDYDTVGNRELRDGQSFTSIFDAANRLLEDEDFCYDYNDNGNLISKEAKVVGACTGGGQLTEYDYDPENQLIEVRVNALVVADYRYDGLGRRIEKDAGGAITRYVYDNEDILLESDGINTLLARYTHGPGIDEPLIMERDLDVSGVFETSEMFFYHADGLGSVTELTDSAGAMAQAYVYDSFGKIVQQVGTLVNPYTYTAREFDVETGLHYYRARNYDPKVGRFLTEDPARSAVDLNFYVYARNNPVIFNDPSGLIAGRIITTAFSSLLGLLGAPAATAQELAFAGFALEAVAGATGLGLGIVIPSATQNQAVPGLRGTTIGTVINVVTFAGALRTFLFANLIAGAGTGGVAAIVSTASLSSGFLALLAGVEMGFAIDNLILDNRSIFPCGNPVLRVFTAIELFRRGD